MNKSLEITVALLMLVNAAILLFSNDTNPSAKNSDDIAVSRFLGMEELTYAVAILPEVYVQHDTLSGAIHDDKSTIFKFTSGDSVELHHRYDPINNNTHIVLLQGKELNTFFFESETAPEAVACVAHTLDRSDLICSSVASIDIAVR